MLIIDNSRSRHVVLGISSLVAIFTLTRQECLPMDMTLKIEIGRIGRKKSDKAVWKENLRRASVYGSRNSGRRGR